MALRDEFRFQRPIGEVLRKKIEPFKIEVGILENKPHRLPARGMKNYAGGSARKVSRKSSGMTVAEVSKEARENLKINYLTRPFRGNRKNQDAIRMMNAFWKLVFGQGKLAMKRRLENATQAVVRNPITRADYGRNKKLTAKIKGSNRKFIDTSQLFRAIKARVRITLRR